MEGEKSTYNAYHLTPTVCILRKCTGRECSRRAFGQSSVWVAFSSHWPYSCLKPLSPDLIINVARILDVDSCIETRHESYRICICMALRFMSRSPDEV